MSKVVTVKTEALGPVTYIENGSEEELDSILTVVLDVSGSMSGSRLNFAKTAINQLKENIAMERVVVFHSQAQVIPFHELEYTHGGGGTSFTAAFRQAVNEFQDGLNVVLFITDGETAEYDVNNAVAVVQNHLILHPDQQVQVHSLGIGGEASGPLLLSLAQIQIAGSIVYITNAADIPPAVAQITELIFNGPAAIRLTEDDEAPDAVIDVKDLGGNEVATLLYTLLQQMPKKDPFELADECDKLDKLMLEVTVDDDVAKDLRTRIAKVREIARAKLPTGEFAKKLGQWCFGIETHASKFKKQITKRVLRGAKAALQILERDQPICEFPDYLKDSGLTCVFTHDTPEEAHEDGGTFGVGLYWTHKDTWAVQPEIGQVKVENVFMSSKGFELAVIKVDANDAQRGVVPNTGIQVIGLLPLIKDWEMLKLFAAWFSTQTLYGLNLHAARALPMLALINLFTEEKTEWRAEMVNRIWPVAKFVVPKDFVKKTVKNFVDTPAGRLPEDIPSLPVFLTRCIVAEVEISEGLVYKIFTEYLRRYVNGLGDETYELKQFWQSTVKVLHSEFNEDDVLGKVMKMWLNRENFTKEGGPSAQAEIVTTMADTEIEKKFKEVTGRWRGSSLRKILTWYWSNKEIGGDFNPVALVANLTTEEKFKFLATAKLTPTDVRGGKLPDLTPKHDAFCQEKVFQMNAGSWLPKFEKTTDVTEAEAILALQNNWQEYEYFRKVLRKNPNIPMSAIKGCLDPNYFVVKVDGKFVHVTTKPNKPFVELEDDHLGVFGF